MCGIVGIYLKNKKFEKNLGKMLSGMLNNMESRGPDSAGFAIYKDESKKLYKFSLCINDLNFNSFKKEISKKLKEYGQRLDLSFIEDEEAKLDGTYPSTDAIDRDIDETAKRDYKDEYKKFQSSKKSKKYRAELNKYNRQKGTYGNGDGKDASHKGGKIVGFESASKNRGRKEKSRLKKESITLDEIGIFPVNNYLKGMIPRNMMDTTTRQKKERLKSTINDLKSTLNHFWKSHDIPYRIK